MSDVDDPTPNGVAGAPAAGATSAGATAAPTAADELGLYPPLARPVLLARVVMGVLIAAAALYAPFYFTAIDNKILSQALYLAIAAMGLNLLTGFTGQVSIGHGAFFGFGAFASASLVADHGWMFEATIPVVALLTAVVGLLVGFPALRVRGLYLALVTLGLAVLFPQVADKYATRDGGGAAAIRVRPDNFDSLVTFLEDDQWAYFLCLALLALLCFATWNLTRARPGRAMIAVREQELAAVTVGVNLSTTKLWAFALSAGYAGIAGALSVMIQGNASATNPALYFQLSIEFLVAVVIGGTATILGPVVGALLVVLLRRNTEGLIEDKPMLSPALFGAALILIVYVMPDGVVGGARRLFARWAQRRSSRDPSPNPSVGALE